MGQNLIMAVTVMYVIVAVGVGVDCNKWTKMSINRNKLGGEIMIDINFLDVTILVVITVALVNLIKNLTGNKLGQWYILISAGVGAVIYAIGLYAPPVVKGFVAVGLIASGLYDIYKKT